MLLELSSLVLLVLDVTKWSAMDLWAWFVLVFGCIAIVSEFYVTVEHLFPAFALELTI